MRGLYQRIWKAGRGFTAEDWWASVRQAAGGRSFEAFTERYVDGREEFPWSEVLPLAGLRLARDTVREPRIGVGTVADSADNLIVREVVPGSSADSAGVKPGDRLISVGDIALTGADFGPAFRRRYSGSREGSPFSLVVEREGRRLTLSARLRLVPRIVRQLEFDPRANAKAARIRAGLLRG
jgi:predicted metalloprotease with PDZ domain